MPIKLCALFTGAVFLFFGISGCFPSLVSLPPDRMRFFEMHMIGHLGFVYAWMPVNIVHNVVYILLGASGVLSAPVRLTATLYCRGLFFLTTMMAITGLLPFGIAQLWGLMPLFGFNIMVHVVLAVLLYYYGFIYPLDEGGAEPSLAVEST